MSSTSTKVELLQFIIESIDNDSYCTSYISYVGLKDGVFCAEISQSLVKPIVNGPMNSWSIIIPLKPYTNEVLLDDYGIPLRFVWGNEWFEWADQRKFDAAGGLIGYK